MKGIDISYHNGAINFVKVKSAGIDFAMIRAGYGLTTDNLFHTNIKAAKAAGIMVGVYWFAYALNVAEAVNEADYCHRLLAPYKLDLPVFYDFEADTERYAGTKGVKYTAESRTSIIKTFCDRIKALGHTAGVYLNPDYITSRTNYAVLKPYTLWLARWVSTSGTASFAAVPDTKVDNSFNKVAVWQFGMSKVDGISGNVDIDYGYFDLPVVKSVPAVKPPVIADIDYSAIVVQKCNLEKPTVDYINRYTYSKELWRKLAEKMK